MRRGARRSCAASAHGHAVSRTDLRARGVIQGKTEVVTGVNTGVVRPPYCVKFEGSPVESAHAASPVLAAAGATRRARRSRRAQLRDCRPLGTIPLKYNDVGRCSSYLIGSTSNTAVGNKDATS